ncbi:glyoxylase-like metal-dependent hydrolase (beta-lactamase superfamily II) [Comamonas sp. BIGb0152]|uniref:MBL fold metallo-hydrolase n=1 Tax=Comamonas sp. BIGb0152 TaxID=2940601 RepID=UPI0021684FDD|nr:MBL fold metallo-hydrolase [Comamonas sp. BIGb0152]MCS4295620.1 glyoxylase-like metal-dependent hydrolase (beta-lactamase superfamily II) [Comamonas sp. BIGb0152]
MASAASFGVQAFFDAVTSTVSYVLHDVASREAAVVDPVWDFDAKSGRSSTLSAQRIVDYLQAQQLDLRWVLETHAHADHLSAAQWLRAQVPAGAAGTAAPVVIGQQITTVQKVFGGIYGMDDCIAPQGADFDRLLCDGDVLVLGATRIRALGVPGHTPVDLAYAVEAAGAVAAIFVGDTLFMPDVGTARCDFPGGDARALYRSISRLLAHPPQTVLYVCHDYPPAWRTAAWCSTVAEQRAHNIHVHDGVNEAAFVAMREARDATLGMPQLMLPSVQVNIRAGRLPDADAQGRRFLKLPVNAL